MTQEDIENIIIELGYDVVQNTKSSIVFLFNGNEITYYFKSKWSSGRGINDGRGWEHLYRQIKPETLAKCPCCGRDLNS